MSRVSWMRRRIPTVSRGVEHPQRERLFLFFPEVSKAEVVRHREIVENMDQLKGPHNAELDSPGRRQVRDVLALVKRPDRLQECKTRLAD